jgi:hypothetical protein
MVVRFVFLHESQEERNGVLQLKLIATEMKLVCLASFIAFTENLGDHRKKAANGYHFKTGQRKSAGT